MLNKKLQEVPMIIFLFSGNGRQPALAGHGPRDRLPEQVGRGIPRESVSDVERRTERPGRQLRRAQSLSRAVVRGLHPGQQVPPPGLCTTKLLSKEELVT